MTQRADAAWLYGGMNLAAYCPPYKPITVIDRPLALGPVARNRLRIAWGGTGAKYAD